MAHKVARKTRHLHSRLIAIVVIIVVAGVGAIYLISAHAQSTSIVTRATAGTLSSCGTAMNQDATASGGSAVQFGTIPTKAVGTTTQNAPTTSIIVSYDDTQWNWPSSTNGYSNFTINVTPEADGSPDGYFFAAEFYFVNNQTGYLGLQTNISNISNTDAKGDIFSVWGALSASGAQIITPFTEGTSGLSAKNDYQWVVGHMYTYKLSYLSTEADGEHWEAFVTDDTTCTTNEIGEMVVPTSYGLLSNAVISFHEHYSGDSTSCSTLPKSAVQFTDPLFNNSAPTSYNNVIPDITGCTQYYGVENISGGYLSVIGGLPPTP